MKHGLWLVLIAAGALGCGAQPNAPGARAEDKKESPREARPAVVELDSLKSKAPADWKEEETSNRMRLYQFRLPAAGGDKEDAELVIFYFGEGGGGSAADNVKRWKGMFNPPEGKTIEDVSSVEKMKVGDVDVTYLDVHGTYRFKARPFDPSAREELRPDYRMIGVVFESAKGPYFIRLVGPDKTVEGHKKEFDDWLKAFK